VQLPSLIKAAFENAFTTSDAFEPFPERKVKNPAVKKLAEDGKFPYLTEGCEFYDIVKTFAAEWLEQAGDEASNSYTLAF